MCHDCEHFRIKLQLGKDKRKPFLRQILKPVQVYCAQGEIIKINGEKKTWIGIPAENSPLLPRRCMSFEPAD